MLKEPSVVERSEPEPIARLEPPVVIEDSESLPIAKFEESTSVRSIKPLVSFRTFLVGEESN
jgi:hypothetical protein